MLICAYEIEQAWETTCLRAVAVAAWLMPQHKKYGALGVHCISCRSTRGKTVRTTAETNGAAVL
jgi:hypothetical protein